MECLVLTFYWKTFAKYSRKVNRVLQERPTGVSHWSDLQECPTRDYKSVPQECARKSVPQEAYYRVSYKSVLEECHHRMS